MVPGLPPRGGARGVSPSLPPVATLPGAKCLGLLCGVELWALAVGGPAGPQGGWGLCQLAPAPRLVPGVPAGLGPLLPPGRPQHADALRRVVGLRDRELPRGYVGRRGAGRPTPRPVVHPPSRAPCQTVSFQQAGLGPAQPSLGLAQSGHLGMISSQRWSEMELVQPEHLVLINGLRTESKQPGLEWPQETFQSTPDPIYR